MSTYHDNGLPGLGDAGTAPGPAVEEVDSLSPGGERRGGEGALGKEGRRGEDLCETDHFGFCLGWLLEKTGLEVVIWSCGCFVMMAVHRLYVHFFDEPYK
jgi:hypothetical protein